MAKLFTDSKNPQAYKALVAAAYAEFKVETVTVNVNEWSDLKQKSPYGKVPVLETSEATLNEANAIARYIARNSKGYALYGKSASEAGLIENWIDFAANEVEFPGGVWTLPIQGKIPENPDATGRAKADIRKALETVDKHMSTRTFLVGHRLTLADVVVSMSFLTLYELVLDESFRKQFVNANRWFKTCINQPQFKSVLGEVQLSVKMAVAKESAPREVKKEQPKKEEKKEQPKKEEKKEQPKKEQPKKEEEEDELEEKKEKKKNPLDDLPASKFVMDDWKRFYSNNETSDSIKYFWENYDPAGYSVWFGEYKDPEQNTKLFMTLNLVNGFIQRLEYLRKYGFGSIVLFGEEPRLEIGGCFVVRGNEIPAEMSECPDFESYDWRRGDLSKSEDKKLLEGYWAWDPEIGGRKFNQGKIFK